MRLYFILDGLTRAVLWVTKNSTNAHYIHRNLLDCRIQCVDQGSIDLWNRNSNSDHKFEDFKVLWLQVFENKIKPIAPYHFNIKKREQAIIFDAGISFLEAMIDNITVNIHERMFFLSKNDIFLYKDSMKELAPILAEITGMTIEESEKQLRIEYDSLIEIDRRRKYTTWKYELMLSKVTTKEQYNDWKNQVRNHASGVGLI